MIGRGAFAIFLGVTILAIAQVAWWILFLVRIGSDRRHIVMFASEGGFFMALLLAGVWLMYRTLMEQVRLREQRATFLSAVTHELKSPLAAIRLFLETIERGRADEQKRKELVRKMLLDVDRLDGLVTDLLHAGRIDAGRLEPAEAPVPLAPLAEDVAVRASERLEGEDTLTFRAEGAPVVLGDADLLRSAVQNLVENAIKYSPSPRRIEVVTRSLPTLAEVEIADEGVGIDPAFLAQAFEPFSRGFPEEARLAKGTGLGLFIVRGIAEAHGGQAFIESRAPARGTRAGFRLPLAPAPAASPHAGQAAAVSPSPQPAPAEMVAKDGPR